MEIKNSYDNVPYESQAFAQTHPDRLATISKLFGLSPTPITKCRVLELGCASGGNIIPMAFYLPDSEFIGVDLSQRQLEQGVQAIADLKLNNIQLRHQSIIDIDSSWGCFDYIICHGVYSWVSEQVQEKILSLSSENLTSQGVSYISYNTYPGWHMREMIRHMMLYHANRFSPISERIEQARAIIDFLADSVPSKNDYYGMLLKNEVNLIRQCKDWYLFHDHLEDENNPLYFHQFIDRAKQHGLQYLGESDFSTMLTMRMPPKIQEILKRISNNNIIYDEQYMDFIRNRHFRQTLLCHQDIALKRDLDAENVESFLIAAEAAPENDTVVINDEKNQVFKTSSEVTVATSVPLTKAALTVLHRHWPRACTFESLYEQASKLLDDGNGSIAPQKNRKMIAEDLLLYPAILSRVIPNNILLCIRN